MALSPRDFEILTSLASGLSVKQVAYVMGVSTVTIYNRLVKILIILQARTYPEAVSHAYDQGILSPRTDKHL